MRNNTKSSRTRVRSMLVASAALALLVAACGGTSSESPNWTYEPVESTPAASASPAESTAPSEPAETTEPSEPAETAEPSEPAETTVPSEPAEIALELTPDLKILQDGEQATSLTVKEGQTIKFVVTNTSGFPHNLYIGTPEQLAANQVSGLPGIPDFNEGTEEFEYTVTAETADLEFACTVPGHYQLMHGTFVVEP